MARSTEDMRTEDAALREIARDPGDYYAGKAADARVLREALAQAEARLHAARTGDDWKRVPQLGTEAARLREALERAKYVGD